MMFSESFSQDRLTFRETKDTVRVSLQKYLFTGSSKATSCRVWQKEYGYRTSWRGDSSTPGTYLNSTLCTLIKRALKSSHGRWGKAAASSGVVSCVFSRPVQTSAHRSGSGNQVGPGSVRLRFLHGMVRAVPVFGSDGSSLERACSVSMLFCSFGSGFGS